jgi:SAM-dependent methyltransferase
VTGSGGEHAAEPDDVADPDNATSPDDAAELPERPIDPDWLALREPADIRSRDLAEPVLLPALLAALPQPPDRPLRVVDLGAGTGANLRWLAPRLPVGQQHWTLVDHDPRLPSWAPAGTALVRADVAELGSVLPGLAPDLVTASALLDLLDRRRLAAVVDALVTAGAVALFSLSVTGTVRLSPADPRDSALAAAFDAHQRRDGRLGPDAGQAAAALFRRRGWSVLEAATPWLLDAGSRGADAELIEAWLRGRVEPAVEQQPDLFDDAIAWLGLRLAQLEAGELVAEIGHLDVLARPPAGPERTQE